MKGIKEKNFCEKCKKTTWHEYKESSRKIKGQTKCLDCGNIRIL